MAENSVNQDPENVDCKGGRGKHEGALNRFGKSKTVHIDKSHALHYHTNAKAEAWDEISKTLKTPSEYLLFLF